jgi:phosphatidate cytidylyltransferase
MPFNWQTFRTRTLSAIVFVIVMMIGLLWNHWSFFVLFSIIHFGCWIEYQKLVEKIDPNYKKISAIHKYGVMIAGWGFMLWMTNEAYTIGDMRMAEVGFWMLVIGGVAVNIDSLISRRGKLIAHSLMGLLYISLSLGLLIALTNIEFNNPALNLEWQRHPGQWRQYPVLLPCFVIICMWVNDTMAYIVGSLIGKTPFSKISPKKTWEGTIGGVLLCGLVMGWIAFVFDEWFVFGKSFLFWFIAAIIAAILGTIGDLFESKLKRLAGVKDSGQMMPGHGGFLDRFDSLLLATPFVWLYIWLFV